MSSATGFKKTDGQRLSPRMAAICGASTPGVSAAGRNPAPFRAAFSKTFKAFAAPFANDAASRDLTVDGGSNAKLMARLYEPEGLGPKPGLLVFFHGGGFVFGSVESHDGACRFLAKRAACKVLSVEYRMAPEHRFPTAHDDAIASFEWAVAHADELGVDPERIAIGGDSAGGNLAASTALNAPTRPTFALLIYPVVDADLDRYRSTQLFARGPLLSRKALLDMMTVNYAPSPRDQLDPRLSVIDAENLERMPPAYVCTGGMDPLRDQGEAFADKLKAAGVTVTQQRFDNLPHGFFSLLVEPDAKRASEIVASAAARGMAELGGGQDAGQPVAEPTQQV